MPKAITSIIKFDGEALKGKSMDVNHLAPSLLALGDLIKESNRMFNGESRPLRILVNADLQQNCFELEIEVIKNLWQTTTDFINNKEAVTIKEILEWLGIIGAPIISLYALIKFLRNKKVDNVKHINKDNIELSIIGGDNNKMIVKKQVYNIYANKTTLQHSLNVLKPLRETGYDSLCFYNKGQEPHTTFTKDEVPNIEDIPHLESEYINTSTITSIVGIRKVAFEGDSKWTLMYKRTIEAEIMDKYWLKSFQANEIKVPPKSKLKVEMEEKTIVDKEGIALAEPSYTVTKVLEVILPTKNKVLFD